MTHTLAQYVIKFISYFNFSMRKSIISSCYYYLPPTLVCCFLFAFVFHHSFKFKYNFYPYGKILLIVVVVVVAFRVNREKQRAIVE